MTEKDFISSYREIKAPDSLREKVFMLEAEMLASKAIKRKRILRALTSGIAACLVLVTALTVFLRTDTAAPILMYGDDAIGEMPVSIVSDEEVAVAFGIKSIERSGIPFEISADGETKVSVSDGMLLVFNSKTGELLSVVTDITVNEDTSVKWDISEISDASPVISLESEKGLSLYCLSFGEEGYTICLTDSE